LKSLKEADICEYIKEALTSAKLSDDITDNKMNDIHGKESKWDKKMELRKKQTEIKKNELSKTSPKFCGSSETVNNLKVEEKKKETINENETNLWREKEHFNTNNVNEKKIEQSFSEKLGKDNIEQQRSLIELREKKSQTKKKKKEQNEYFGQKDIRKEEELVFKEEKHSLGIIANNFNKDNKKKNLNESESDFSLQNIKEKKSKLQKNEVDKIRPGCIEKYVKINKKKSSNN